MLDIDVEYQRGNFSLRFTQKIEEKVIGLFGPSGIGKSTLLALIAGLITPEHGHIRLCGEYIFDRKNNINIPSCKRRIATVFQDDRLFPHLSVRDNLLYGFKLLNQSQRKISLDEVVHLLELEALMKQQPYQLSGGEAQRVALGRGLLMSPKLLLLDEPLSSLDERLKQQILPFLKRIKTDIDVPMIYVSHDIKEITYLADKVIYL